MRLELLVGTYLVTQAAAAPLAIPTYFTTTPYSTLSTFEFQKRQTRWICQYVSPNDRMPPVSEASAIADYLESLGQGGTCKVERRVGTQEQSYMVWVTEHTEFSLYFSQKPENSSVYSASYYCDYLAKYLRELINACQTDGRVQGYVEIPNCPNKGVAYIVGQEPTAEGGSSIEIMPKGTRTRKSAAVMMEEIPSPAVSVS